MNSRHYAQDRKERERLIKETIGYGKVIRRCNIDMGRVEGPEIHEISDTGIISIYNAWTGRLVTRIIGRPGQIKRYYNNDAPKKLLEKARENQLKGYNFV